MRAGLVHGGSESTGGVQLTARMCMLAVALAGATLTLIGSPGFAHAAAPEIGRCLKASGGAYEDGACTTLNTSHTGKFEWVPGLVKSGFTFASKAVYPTRFQENEGVLISCESGLHGTGTVTALSLDNLVLHSTCQEEITGQPACTTPGLASGEIDTTSLTGQLGFITRSPLAVGLALSAGSGEPFSLLGCRRVRSLWGGVIAKVPKVNKMMLFMTLIYKDPHSRGLQQYSQLEGEPPLVLAREKPGGIEVALETTPVVTFEEKTEIRVLP